MRVQGEATDAGSQVGKRFSFRGSMAYAAERALLTTLAEMPAGRRSPYIRELMLTAYRVHGEIIDPSGMYRDLSLAEPAMLTAVDAACKRIYFTLNAAARDEARLITHLTACGVGRRPTLVRALALEGFRLGEQATKSLSKQLTTVDQPTIHASSQVAPHLHRRATDRFLAEQLASATPPSGKPRKRKIAAAPKVPASAPAQAPAPAPAPAVALAPTPIATPTPTFTPPTPPLSASVPPPEGLAEAASTSPIQEPIAFVPAVDQAPTPRDPRLMNLGNLVRRRPSA